jgi:hypothetical protein
MRGDYPIVFKMSPVHLVEGGRTMEEGIRIAQVLERAGVAAIQVDVGAFDDTCYELIAPVYHQERVKQFDVAAKIKETVSIPVFTQGKVGDPAEARAVFEEGKDRLSWFWAFVPGDPNGRTGQEDRIEDIVRASAAVSVPRSGVVHGRACCMRRESARGRGRHCRSRHCGGKEKVWSSAPAPEARRRR